MMVRTPPRLGSKRDARPLWKLAVVSFRASLCTSDSHCLRACFVVFGELPVSDFLSSSWTRNVFSLPERSSPSLSKSIHKDRRARFNYGYLIDRLHSAIDAC
jgi:hypothetical protein